MGRMVSVQLCPLASVTRTTSGTMPPVPDWSSTADPRAPVHDTAARETWEQVQLELRTVRRPAPDWLPMVTVMAPATGVRTRTEMREPSPSLTSRTVTVGFAPPGSAGGGSCAGGGLGGL